MLYILVVSFIYNGVYVTQQISDAVPRDVCVNAMMRAVVGDDKHSGSVNCIPEGTLQKPDYLLVPFDQRKTWSDRKEY